MTLVNVETGEIVVQCTADEARALTDRIKVAVDVTWQLVAEAYQRRAWAALGFASWDDYTTREFGTSRLRLPREDRSEVVGSLRDAGLSIRAIAAVTGESVGAVHRSLPSGVPDGTPEDEGEVVDTAPESVTGTDGKVYPSRKGISVAEQQALTAEREERIRTLAAEGLNAVEIAAEMGLSTAAVSGIATRAGISTEQRWDRQKFADRVKALVAKGMRSSQIAAELGVSESHVRRRAAEHGVVVTADELAGRARGLDSSRIVREGIHAIEGAVMGFDLADVDDLDETEVEAWAASLKNSIRSLNRFLKEMAP